MGTEAEGLTDFWLQNATKRIKIPMHGKIDSLNVSVSTAVLTFEAMRQGILAAAFNYSTSYPHLPFSMAGTPRSSMPAGSPFR